MGKLIRAITSDGGIVGYAIDSTDMVNRAAEIHQPSAVVTAALGRLLSAASMMGIMLKGKNDTVTVQINGDGPVGPLTAVADSSGSVKGYATNPVVEIPLRSDGKLNVGAAVGKNGFVTVIKDLRLKEPYIGKTRLVSGEIAEDITSYYAQSEQVPTICALGVLVGRDLSVQVSGGYIVQLLPFTGDEVIDTLEANLKSMEPVTVMLSKGMTPEEILRKALAGFEVEILDETEAAYRCDCSRGRVERALSSLGEKELRDMIKEQNGAEVCCHFCGGKYQFSGNELEQMIGNLNNRPAADC